MSRQKTVILLVGAVILGAAILVFPLEFFWSRSYYVLVYVMVLLGFAVIFLQPYYRNPGRRSRDQAIDVPAEGTGRRLETVIRNNFADAVYAVFLPLALFPFLTCIFKVPFIFCTACPRRCPWGELRPLLVAGMIFQNLGRRHWCFYLCPLGRLQDLQTAVAGRRAPGPAMLRPLHGLRYLLMILTLAAVIMTALDPIRFGIPFLHGTAEIAIAAFAVIFFTAFLIPRFWCRYLCPLGAFSDALTNLARQLPWEKQRDG